MFDAIARRLLAAGVSLPRPTGARRFGERVGINQVLRDPATQTLVLRERPVAAATLALPARDHRRGARHQGQEDQERRLGRRLRPRIRPATPAARTIGATCATACSRFAAVDFKVVAASLFSTQSTTADLAKIHRQIEHSTPAPRRLRDRLDRGRVGARSVSGRRSVSDILFNRQTGTAPPVFTTSHVPDASARHCSQRRRADRVWAASARPTTRPPQVHPGDRDAHRHAAAQGPNDLIVQLFLPAGAEAGRGWPVAIFGHGFGDSMYGAPWTVAATLASRGIATVSITVVGHGGGPLGTLSVLRGAQPT